MSEKALKEPTQLNLENKAGLDKMLALKELKLLLEINAVVGKEGKAKQGSQIREGKAVFREIQLHNGFDTRPCPVIAVLP